MSDTIPRTGLFSGYTIYGVEICVDVPTLSECERLVREYQKANGNPLCRIAHERPVKSHLKVVDPIEEPQAVEV